MRRTFRLKLLPLALLPALAVMAHASTANGCSVPLGPQGESEKQHCEDRRGKSDPAPKPDPGSKGGGGMPTPAPKMPPLI